MGPPLSTQMSQEKGLMLLLPLFNYLRVALTSHPLFWLTPSGGFTSTLSLLMLLMPRPDNFYFIT